MRTTLRLARTTTHSPSLSTRRALTTTTPRLQSNSTYTPQRRAPYTPSNTSATSSHSARPAIPTDQAAKLGASPTPTRSPSSAPRQPPVPTKRQSIANPPQDPILDISQSGLSDAPSTRPQQEEQVDWTTSFSGLSSQAFSKEAADILLAPLDVDDIEIKPDGILYLPEIKYRRILNRAFGPGGWGLAPRGETIVTAKAVTREYALVANGRYARNRFDSPSVYTSNKMKDTDENQKQTRLNSARRTRLFRQRRHPHRHRRLQIQRFDALL